MEQCLKSSDNFSDATAATREQEKCDCVERYIDLVFLCSARPYSGHTSEGVTSQPLQLKLHPAWQVLQTSLVPLDWVWVPLD